MPRNGSGAMTRVHDWTVDAAAQVPITASRVDDDTDDIANEITNSVAKDGQSTMSGNLKMGNNRVTGMGAGTALTDASTLQQTLINGLTYMASTGSANAYVLTPSPAITAYADGQAFAFKANFTNSGAATVAISGLTAQAIKKRGSTALDAGDITSGSIYIMRYDGTNFQLLNPGTIEIIGDTSPQLGGALDTNSFGINMADTVLSRPEIKDYAESYTAANSSTAYTVDITNGNVFEITMTGNCTFTFSNPSATGKGCSFTMILKQDGTGSRTATWPASVDWSVGGAPTLTTTAAAVDIVTFLTVDAGTRWYGFLGGVNFS